ncbi:MAG: hypothetical protein QXV30_07075 [Desulfurococcaceae archaeon]
MDDGSRALWRLSPRHSRCGVPLNAPKPDENPRGMQGNKDEAMKTININLYKS